MNNFTCSNKGMDALEAKKLMESVIDLPDVRKIKFLSELHENPPTPEQIRGFAMALRESAAIKLYYPGLTDIVGTGGDGKNTVNVSTGSSILLASMGIKVAKHGNFGITGHHGSADFLKYLNYNFDMDQEAIINNLDKINYVFMLAPQYNKNFAKFAVARKSLPYRTIFNILGPLTNPLNPERVILGTYDDEIARIYADVILNEQKKGFVVHSADGLDELSPMEENHIYYIDGIIKKIKLDGRSIVDSKIELADISERDSIKSFEMLLAGLKGRNKKVMQFIALNAAPAILINELCSSIEEGYAMAMEHMEKGRINNILGVISQ
ncbi:MAG: anthranilate phosphoribosyltransferase [Ferroplasma sp.]